MNNLSTFAIYLMIDYAQYIFTFITTDTIENLAGDKFGLNKIVFQDNVMLFLWILF